LFRADRWLSDSLEEDRLKGVCCCFGVEQTGCGFFHGAGQRPGHGVVSGLACSDLFFEGGAVHVEQV
jgi:hypothetical protein